MKIISLILIFCFLCQHCISISTGLIISEIDESRQERLRVKDCAFKEILEQRVEKYGRYHIRPFIAPLAIVDLAMAIQYYLRVNPVGFELYLNGLYATMAIFMIVTVAMDYNKKVWIHLSGWEHRFAGECKADYFVKAYSDEASLKQNETNFIKQLLYYSGNFNNSTDENFARFQKDFLRNNKIETYIDEKTNRFFRYIYYRGGKKKFEEDFRKYLYLHSD